MSPPHESSDLGFVINREFDGVIMLAQADWQRGSKRGSSYWAERFAHYLPVVVVRPGQRRTRRHLTGRQEDNITLVEVSISSNGYPTADVFDLLVEHGLVRPLLWVDNYNFGEVIAGYCSPLKVYYAREDYFQQSEHRAFLAELRHTLALCDLLVAVSEPLLAVYRERGGYQGRAEVVPDGCDNSSVAKDLVSEQRAAVRATVHQEEFDGAPTWSQDDYRGFGIFVSSIIERAKPRRFGGHYNVLVLYDSRSLHTSTVHEYLDSFDRFSAHQIWYAPATWDAPCDFDLAWFDAVFVNYSVRLVVDDCLAPDYRKELVRFRGLKALFIQDEYDFTERARRSIEEIGFQLVFTCVPPGSVDQVYPVDRFPHVRFESILTGYVPEHLAGISRHRPAANRHRLIGYRGRELPFWYGSLGREKLEIGSRMREICDSRGLEVDIEWEESKRIYGDAWYEFLAGSRATLGTESGSNVFDWDGSLRVAVSDAVSADPDRSFEDIYDELIREHDGQVLMNQISPKVFEAAACRTALVLFEGEYSGIFKPDIHYIALAKDFSNVDDVLEKVLDDQHVDALTDRVYRDVIESELFGYRRFMEGVDRVIGEELGVAPERRLASAVFVGFMSFGTWARVARPPQSGLASEPELTRLERFESWLANSWRTIVPRFVQGWFRKLVWLHNLTTRCRPVLYRVVAALRRARIRFAPSPRSKRRFF